MSKTFTHTGIVEGISSCVPKGYKYTVKLRELKTCWVTDGGKKYRKRNGWPVGDTWAHYALDIKSIKPIPQPPPTSLAESFEDKPLVT